MEEKRKAYDLAGHCNEPTAWQILMEVSKQMIERKQFVVNPSIIEIADAGEFLLLPPDGQNMDKSFEAPPSGGDRFAEADAVWSLGSTMFFIVMGQMVMNGRGGIGQKETSKLPYMRSEWPKMSELVQQCLHYLPSRRLTLQRVFEIATQQHERCVEEIRRGPRLKKITEDTKKGTINATRDTDFWPEIMHETQKHIIN